MVKVQKRWRLGDTPVSLRLRYECPLEEVGRFYEPPARLLLRCGPADRWMYSPLRIQIAMRSATGLQTAAPCR